MNESLTYRELNERANGLAHHLIGLGVRPDTRVAICVDRSLAMIIGVLAVLKSGGAYIPLDPAYASDRLIDILDDCTPTIVLADTLGRHTLSEINVRRLGMEGMILITLDRHYTSHCYAPVLLTNSRCNKLTCIYMDAYSSREHESDSHD
jgi:non-ribosomal peptide synthetase component F